MSNIFKLTFILITLSLPIFAGNKKPHHPSNKIHAHKQENDQSLKLFSDNFLKTNKPKIPFALLDSKDFIELRLNTAIHSDNKTKELEKIYTHLKQYYKSIHMEEDFNNFEFEIKKRIVFDNYNDKNFLSSQFFIGLCDEVCDRILNNITDSSITNHPNQLLTSNDIKFIKEIAKSLKNEKVTKILTKINSELKAVDKILGSHTKLFSQLNSNKLIPKLVVESKKTLFDLELSIGRKFLIKDLLENSHISKKNREGLARLIEYSNKRGPEVDDAFIKSLIEEHHQAHHHPLVVIEGGGPTGLLSAITQFQAGAYITLFEKRNGLYDRTQIVRLDPLWMSMLKYYLGESYYHLFIDPGHKAILRPDGFGEIATRDLEEEIHILLTKIMSSLDSNDLAIERFTAHEIVDVLKPEVFGEKFQVHSKYIPSQDMGKQPKKITKEIRDLDILICSGGKSSSMVKMLLPSSTQMNKEKYYGVCSWLSDSYYDPQFKYFKDFRGVIKIDDTFIADFHYEIEGLLAQKLGSEIAHELSSQNPFILVDWLKNPYLQTRTFENRGLLYIGMELPEAFRSYLEGLEKIPFITKDEINFVKKEIQKAWFKKIADIYAINSSFQIDLKFLTTFPVGQNRLSPDFSFPEIKNGDSKLLVAAAGDAFASPHFMRYSGLTGARENIIDLQTYMRGHIANKSEEKLLEDLATKGDCVANFVLNRGKAFLDPLKQKKIERERKISIKNSIEFAMEQWDIPDATITKTSKNNYHLDYLNVDYKIEAKSGYILVSGGIYTNQIFSSLKHFLLTIQE